MRIKPAALALSIALILSACGSEDPLGPPTGLDGAWQLTSGTHDGDKLEPIVSHPVTLEFDGEHIGGTAACNGYGGTVDIGEGEIEFSEISITEMGCSPPETMELEQRYIAALLAVTEVTVDDATLILSGDSTRLEFDALPPVPTAELQNTVWVLDGLVSGESVSSVVGERATLELFSDGSFLASTGCRTIAGNYVESGGGIETTSMSVTGECPTEFSAQDVHVVTVLEGSYRVEINGQSLVIAGTGDEGLTYKADN